MERKVYLELSVEIQEALVRDGVSLREELDHEVAMEQDPVSQGSDGSRDLLPAIVLAYGASVSAVVVSLGVFASPNPEPTNRDRCEHQTYRDRRRWLEKVC
jgi:hypothetical protein